MGAAMSISGQHEERDTTDELARAVDRLAAAIERMELRGDIPKRESSEWWQRRGHGYRLTDNPRSSEAIHD